MSIFDHTIKDVDVSEEFDFMNISTTEKPSPFVTCRKGAVEEVDKMGRRLRAKHPARARRMQSKIRRLGPPDCVAACNEDICCDGGVCPGCESVLMASCGPDDAAMIRGHCAEQGGPPPGLGPYCDFTGPDEEPCCAKQSRADQEFCLEAKGLPLEKEPFIGGMGFGSGSGSGSGYLALPDMLMSPEDAIAGCEVLTGGTNIFLYAAQRRN
jgi:hypothetical protein